MNLKATLILVAVFALAIAALVLTRDNAPGSASQQTSEGDNEADPTILPQGLLGPKLSGIRFEHNPNDAANLLDLELAQGKWQVSYPHTFPRANTKQIDQLLATLNGLRGKTSDTPYPDDQSLSGLVLSFNQQRQAIRLGPRLGVGRAVLFVQDAAGSFTAYNAQDTLHDLFDNLNAASYYGRSIPQPLLPQIGRVEITAREIDAVLVQDNGQWWIGEGSTAERALNITLPGKVETEIYPGLDQYFELFNQLKLIEQHAYRSPAELDRFGLDNPQITVRFLTLGTDPADPNAGWTLRVGSTTNLQDPENVLSYISYGKAGDKSPAVFTAPHPIASAFAQPGTLFRDPRIVTTPPTLTEWIDLFKPTARYRITFKDDGTQAVSLNSDRRTQNRPAKTYRAGLDILYKLFQARPIEYVAIEPITLEQISVLRLKPRFKDQQELVRFYIDPGSTPDRPTVLIRNSDAPIAMRFDRSVVAELLDTDFYAAAEDASKQD